LRRQSAVTSIQVIGRQVIENWRMGSLRPGHGGIRVLLFLLWEIGAIMGMHNV
jgi:hypothetical protein